MSDRKTNLEKYRYYFYGDVPALHAGFLSRFADPEVATPLSVRNFVCQNEIRAILEKRIGLVPQEGITFTAFRANQAKPDDALGKWLDEWLKGPHFADGRNFYEFATEMLQHLEMDGELALKLILRNGVPQIRRIPDEALEIVTNPDNLFEVTEYIARWNRDLEGEWGARQVQIEERIDAEKYSFELDGKVEEQKHAFGFVPVVLIKREDIQGEVHGRSGVADLLEPQDNLNRCLVNIARANKYGPWGLYCTEETGSPLPDGDITVAPGALVGAPIRKVSGDGAAECLFREKEEILDAMYRIAGLSRNKAEEMAQADRTSGKALTILNAQGKRYVEGLIARLRRGYEQLGLYALAMAGKIPDAESARVAVAFPSLDREDPAQVNERAKLLFALGLPREVLRTLGYEEEKIDKLLTEDIGPEGSLLSHRRGDEWDA
jgi:hypothetical protein